MATTTSTTVRAGTRRELTERYTGVLRTGSQIVAECGHTHTNRDISGRRNPSARDCITDVIRAAQKPELAIVHAAQIRLSWERAGAVSAAGVERDKAAAEQAALDYEALIIRVRELLNH